MITFKLGGAQEITIMKMMISARASFCCCPPATRCVIHHLRSVRTISAEQRARLQMALKQNAVYFPGGAGSGDGILEAVA